MWNVGTSTRISTVNLSINQILDVWSELEAAYYGKNGYGGDTAEIYMYKFMPYDPLFVMYQTCCKSGAKSYESVIKNANLSMFTLLNEFKNRHDCHIWLEYLSFEELDTLPDFIHRVHIRIERK